MNKICLIDNHNRPGDHPEGRRVGRPSAKVTSKTSIGKVSKVLSEKGYSLEMDNFDVKSKTARYKVTGPDGKTQSLTSKEVTKLANQPFRKSPGGKTSGISKESATPPPPGKSYTPNVKLGKAARVGVPGDQVPPPQPIGRLPNLTADERRVEGKFISSWNKDPQGMADNYRQAVKAKAKKKGEPPTFETDEAKMLSPDWNDSNLDRQMKKRQTYNNALHGVANATAKKAFVDELDTLKPGDRILVTNGGCGAGKGFTLNNTEVGKNLKSKANIVWDSAGDQNSTENSWIAKEAEKRGLKVTYAYVHADPRKSWAGEFGVVKRAHDKKNGRMVDAAVFADSYAQGARNHNSFHMKNKNNPNLEFKFFTNGSSAVGTSMPKDALGINHDELYDFARKTIKNRPNTAPSVKRGALQGERIWGEDI